MGQGNVLQPQTQLQRVVASLPIVRKSESLGVFKIRVADDERSDASRQNDPAWTNRSPAVEVLADVVLGKIENSFVIRNLINIALVDRAIFYFD